MATRREPLRQQSGTERPSLSLSHSVGYQIRTTHRLLQRALQRRIEPHGVTLGMWYYLRVLWDHDGLTQRELSRRIGTMEPTTFGAVAIMEQHGLVFRVRNSADRRKINIFLTKKGRELESILLPSAIEVVRIATRSLSEREQEMFLSMLTAVQDELESEPDQGGDTLNE